MELINVKYKVKDFTAYVTINRPKALNALNIDVIAELKTVFEHIEADDGVTGVILTGEGEKAFVAGADIAQMKDMTALESRAMAAAAHKVMNSIEECSKPVIAAINGFALGGGCELAMACDIRIASETARMGQPEVNLGIIPGFGGTQRLPRLVGKGMAKYLILTAGMIDAAEAYRIGLVQKVAAPSELIAECEKVLAAINQKGPFAVKLAKKAINNGLEADQKSALNNEIELFSLTFATDEQEEGMAAFLEKRAADFKSKK
ncbi:MAG: enoyl-CoA hydratase-related protein [Spirochaetales bacterium]|uniref:Enoyl-CoA hydratase-related protein n=1 Tax=Candidatus Thalassospirochaeta sargassi TaxID=3119039 RepID=A0AAJ1IG98_9SPIO|nr:enoyl-CoA hydratase-related protein [Spirochaetales bacterium]